MKKINKNSIAIVIMLIVSVIFSFSGPLSASAAGPASVDLGTAGNFVILAKSGISTTGTTSIVGDIGISPAAATFITGFALTLPAAGAFSTSALVIGKVYAPNYANPTPVNMTTAVSNMETAYTDANGRTNPTATELGAGNIGGLTIAPGLYKWGTGVTIPTDVTLSGSANDVWIFQIAQTLTVSSGAKIILSGGAQASNVFWAVAGQTTIGTTAVFNGNILDQTAIVLNTGATLNGRALAQTAVTLDSNAVTVPSSNSSSNSSSSSSSSSSSNSAFPTSTVAQSSTPVTITTSSGNTMTTSFTGCSSGNLYNTSTGALCINNTKTEILGCGNRTTGFSTSSGISCVENRSTATSVYNLGTATLKNGSRGDAVMELQRFLNAKLNLSLVIDGKLGPKTIAVIKQWQNANGLIADGFVGVKTKAKMNAEVN